MKGYIVFHERHKRNLKDIKENYFFSTFLRLYFYLSRNIESVLATFTRGFFFDNISTCTSVQNVNTFATSFFQ